LAPDINTLESSNPRGAFSKTKITTSRWFENKNDLEKLMVSRNLYFAPRLSEGIGMGFLEAMADGMVVLAHDSSTHNEYISSWNNGVLYNMNIQSPAHLDPDDMQRLGDAARQSIADGRPIWERQMSEITEWVKSTPLPDTQDISPDLLAAEIPRAYSAGFGPYVQYLTRNTSLIQKMSPGLNLAREIQTTYVAPKDEPSVSIDAPLLDNRDIRFGKSGTRKYLGNGWSHDEDDFVWIDGTSATVKFATSDESRHPAELILTCHSLRFQEPQRLAIVVNGALCQTIEVYDRKEVFHIPLRNGLQERTEVTFYAEQTASPNNEPRKLSVALYSINFH
jgi:hypothetical protein